MKCKCGCNGDTGKGKTYISGHNLKCLERTKTHDAKIGEAQKLAWKSKRKRLPIGSKNKDTHGYIRVKVKAGAGRWEKEHKIIAEKMMGRELLVGEVVHHVNGKRDDNTPENLVVMDRVKHQSCHRKLEHLVYELLFDDIITFDRESHEYRKV